MCESEYGSETKGMTTRKGNPLALIHNLFNTPLSVAF